mgnify:CR=1 FL=1
MKIKIILSIFILLFLCSPVDATTVDSLVDGGFQSWTDATHLTYWTCDSSTSVIRYGSYYPKMYGGASIYQDVGCTYTEKSQLSFTANARKDVGGTVELKTEFYDSSDNLLDSTSSNFAVTSTSWTPFKHSSIIPVNTAYIRVRISSLGTSSQSIYVDDASLSIAILESFSYFSAVNESNLSETLTNITVLAYNNTYSIQSRSVAGVVALSNITLIDGDYTVKYSCEGYYPRWYTVTTSVNHTGYLAPFTDDTILVSFTIIDYTDTFKYTDSTIRITKPTETGLATVSESGFSASGVSQHYLKQNEPYFLELETEGYTRGMGTFIPTSSETINLVVGNISILPEREAYGGFDYNLTKTNTSISMNWIAPSGSLNEAFNYSIYDKNDTLVYSLSSSSLNGTATYEYGDPEEQYKISIIANTTGGILRHTEYITGEGNLIDLQISDLWYNMISIFLLFTIALCFGYKHASAGAFIVSICAAGFALFGLLRISVLIVALCAYLGILAIFRGRGA